MQASQSGPARLGAVGTTLAVVKNDGVGGLYKGVSSILYFFLVHVILNFYGEKVDSKSCSTRYFDSSI